MPIHKQTAMDRMIQFARTCDMSAMDLISIKENDLYAVRSFQFKVGGTHKVPSVHSAMFLPKSQLHSLVFTNMLRGGLVLHGIDIRTKWHFDKIVEQLMEFAEEEGEYPWLQIIQWAREENGYDH